MRFTGDRATGRLLGVQLFGHRHAEIAKRIDIAATAIFHAMTVDGLSDLDLSYTPPLGSPWDAIQMGAQAWLREASHLMPEVVPDLGCCDAMSGLGSATTFHSLRSGGHWLGASVRLSLSFGHPGLGRWCFGPAAMPPSAISSPRCP